MSELLHSNWKVNLGSAGIAEVEIRGNVVRLRIGGEWHMLGLVEVDPFIARQTSYSLSSPHVWDEDARKVKPSKF